MSIQAIRPSVWRLTGLSAGRLDRPFVGLRQPPNTPISIQSSTGGNLTEILTNLSKVIRERFKMRRSHVDNIQRGQGFLPDGDKFGG